MSDEPGGSDFLFLDEDEVNAEPSAQPEAQDSEENTTSTEEVESTSQPSAKQKEDISTEVVEELAPFDDNLALMTVGGTTQACWSLTGMDCPDCAMKATKAISRIPAIQTVSISAATGNVNVNIDMEQGSLSQVNSVLTSLGHAPEVGWKEIAGVKASHLCERLSMDRRSLERMLRNQPGLLDVDFSPDDRVLIQIPPESSEAVRMARDDALRNLTGKDVELRNTRSSRLRPDQIRLIGAGIAIPLTLLVFIFEILGFSQWLIATLAVPAILIGGYRMFMEAVASLQNRQMGFQVLTTMAVIGASWLGAWSEALLVVVLVAITSHMEGAAIIRARKAMQGGLDRLPRSARLVKEESTEHFISEVSTSEISMAEPSQEGPSLVPLAASGFSLNMSSHGDSPEDSHHSGLEEKGFEQVPLGILQVGDKVEVRSGELIPVDGKVVEGIGSLDVAPLTGESLPVRISTGDEVQAGLVLRRGPVVIEAVAVGDDTRLAGLIDQVHTYRDQPPRFQSTIELFTALWVPLVLFGAPLAYLLSGDVGNWKIMLLLWVVACPCALLLAAPVPHAAALSNAAHKGIVARGGDVIERASRVNLALLDKTGTMTSGNPELAEISLGEGYSRDRVLALAAGVEARSNHPYASVIRELCQQENLKPDKVTSIKDGEAGVSGKIEGKEVMFGRPDWIESKGANISEELQSALIESGVAGRGGSLLSQDGDAIALFTFEHDDTRPGAEELVQSLYAMKINIELLSGDAGAAVTAFGPRVGIPAAACRGDMDPEAKADWVEGRSRTHVVLMAGDGFNDSTALANADIGVAVGSGEQVSLDAADVLLPSEDPRLLAKLLEISAKTKMVVRQNIILSIAITAILVWSVLAGFNDKIWVGVLVHEVSAIFVILNGARLAGERGIFALLRDICVDLYSDVVDSFSVLIEQRAIRNA